MVADFCWLLFPNFINFYCLPFMAFFTSVDDLFMSFPFFCCNVSFAAMSIAIVSARIYFDRYHKKSIYFDRLFFNSFQEPAELLFIPFVRGRLVIEWRYGVNQVMIM